MSVGYNDALKRLQDRASLGVRPGLTRIRDVLQALDNPQVHLHFVHVAGTNGKGSVTAMLASLLQQSLRVGTFTSPGPNGLRGTFSVDGHTAAAEHFSALYMQVMAAEQKASPRDPVTEFEILTIMAILYFSELQADIVVWEAGLGGKSDSTNVVAPRLCVITNVGFDHQDILGHTIPAIAREKAGIIKHNTPVITGAEDAAFEVIRQEAHAKGARVYKAGSAFSTSVDDYSTVQLITYRGIFQDLYRLPLPLLGASQHQNAGIALAAYELLVKQDGLPALTQAQAREAFRKIQWEGRFEVFWHAAQPVVVDGAHNRAAVRALSQSLKDFSKVCRIDSPWLMIIGVLDDKDTETMIDIMLPWLQDVVVCEPDNRRALSVMVLQQKLMAVSRKIRVAAAPSVSCAVKKALNSGRPVCCWGSLYTAMEARETIHEVIGDS